MHKIENESLMKWENCRKKKKTEKNGKEEKNKYSYLKIKKIILANE